MTKQSSVDEKPEIGLRECGRALFLRSDGEVIDLRESAAKKREARKLQEAEAVMQAFTSVIAERIDEAEQVDLPVEHAEVCDEYKGYKVAVAKSPVGYTWSGFKLPTGHAFSGLNYMQLNDMMFDRKMTMKKLTLSDGEWFGFDFLCFDDSVSVSDLEAQLEVMRWIDALVEYENKQQEKGANDEQGNG
jgi:hypothetical protein